jgi:hypothetical protein
MTSYQLTASEGFFAPASDGQPLYVWADATVMEADRALSFSISLVTTGAFAAGLRPGSFTATATDTCEVCADLSDDSSDGQALHYFSGSGGTVNIDAVDARIGGQLRGSATNIQLTEVDANTQPVAGGCQTQLSLNFDVALQNATL